MSYIVALFGIFELVFILGFIKLTNPNWDGYNVSDSFSNGVVVSLFISSFIPGIQIMVSVFMFVFIVVLLIFFIFDCLESSTCKFCNFLKKPFFNKRK